MSVQANVHPLNPDAKTVDELDTIRELLLGPTYEKQAAIDAKLVEIQQYLELLENRTADFSKVIGPSIQKLHAQDENLNVELEPEISSGLYKCFNNHPERMAEVLYPILGPAVRKLVASLFQSSAGEKGNPYQVEQLFLIHKETSVVLSQTILCADAARDADLVSGMLDAIRSFVQEAFALSEFDGMNSINLGDLTIWVEWGPKAILAVVVRGIPDQSLQDHYAEVLRLIHKQYDSDLEQFNGDTEKFQSLDLSGVQTDLAPDSRRKTPKGPVLTFTRLSLLTIALMIAIANHVSAKRSWQYSLKSLSDEPGIVVIDETRGWFRSKLSILRDPLAASKAAVLDRARVDLENVSVSWHKFQSQDTAILERRMLTSSLTGDSRQRRIEP